MKADRPGRKRVASHAARPAVAAPDGKPIPTDQLEQIEALDDVIFAALAGDADALDRAERLWRMTEARAAVDLVEESRRQYIRRAESIVRAYRQGPARELGPAFAACEVLDLVGQGEP